MKDSPVQKLLDEFQAALNDGSFVKLTLASARRPEPAAKQVQVRSIDLRGMPHLSFVYHQKDRDITKNVPLPDGRAVLAEMLAQDFRNAHLFTTRRSFQLEVRARGASRLRERPARHDAAPPSTHDQSKHRSIPPTSPWLHALGVTTPEGKVCRGMEAKFRQINRFVEVIDSFLNKANLSTAPRLNAVDMGCGKGYLTFGLFDAWRREGHREVRIRGIDARQELVDLGNQVAHASHFTGLGFEKGAIADMHLDEVDVVIALHACDTATDDAISKGIKAGAGLIVVSPCCHQELRGQLVPPPALATTLRHGILLEREAEFLTDGLRAALLEWAGYETAVFEFTSTEHTAKNLMIAGVRRPKSPASSEASAGRVRDLAGMFGIRSQRLADVLGFSLLNPAAR